MRVADFIFDFIASQGVDHVFFLPGGGAMHLNDGLRRQTSISAISMLHEQGAAIAAEGFARTSGKFGVCLVTSGPGATNAITGLAGAWFESTPVLFISGQVKRSNMKGDLGVRQLGAQELDVVTMVGSLTKYATCLMDPLQVRRTLQEALHRMMEGRPGPVWIEVPLDVQAAEIDPEALTSFEGAGPPVGSCQLPAEPRDLAAVADYLRQAKRPVLLAGNGIHCSHAEKAFRRLVERLNIPTLTTWTAADLLESSHPLSFGRPGTAAPRAANFTVQNADFVLAIGTRLDFTVTGFDRAQFARGAIVAVVDIDKAEMEKLGDLPDMAVVCDA
ncbi:MAG: thiamine pyrophosphate-binding protein, partial [Proteobacteria bacterium]|nr:thiamine pyrophosphate-binding protein [Pseudomonadota bacterium]